MTNTKEQVLEMVSAGKISAAEGDQLLNAMQTQSRSGWRVLFNPFERLSTAQALLLGAVAAAGGIGLSVWHVRFDGALDVHVGPHSVSPATAAVDQLVAWPLTALVLWGVAFALTRRARVIDFVGAVGVARLPLLGVGAVAAALKDYLPLDPSQLSSASAAPLAILVVLTIPGIVWMVMLLFEGFRTASGLAGPKTKLAFASAVILAEALSWFALHLAH